MKSGKEYMKNRKSEKQGQSLYRKMGKVFALFAVLAGAALIQESMNPVLKQGNVLERQYMEMATTMQNLSGKFQRRNWNRNCQCTWQSRG